MADLGTVTHTEQTHSSVKKIVFDWLSENGGANAGKAQHTTDAAFDGILYLVATNPDGGATQPSDNYTVQLLDDDGVDLLGGGGTANRDTANTEYITSGFAGPATSKITLYVEGAGNAKGGLVYVYLR